MSTFRSTFRRGPSGGGGSPVPDPNAFVLVFNIVSNGETLVIPCRNVGTYSAFIDWGDGDSSDITTFDDADLSHIYVNSGEYTVSIGGIFPNINFDSGGSSLKLIEVVQFGATGFLDMNNSFAGCQNLLQAGVGGSAQDFSGVDDFEFMFSGCTGLTVVGVSGWDVGTGIVFDAMFRGCSSLVTLDVSAWDVGAATTFDRTFDGCTVLVTLDVSSWDVGAATNLDTMLRGCIALSDVAIDGWDIQNVTSASDFMSGISIPTSRYDATLIAWEAQTVQSSVTISFGGSTYTGGGAAETAHDDLINNDLWTITDGGIA